MKKLGFGFMRLPVMDGDWKKIDIEMVKKMVDIYMERGFTYFDTAYVYHEGLSENALKQTVVDRYPRESFAIADKLPIFSMNSADDYQRYFDEELSRCGVEYFDYILLHAIGKDLYSKPFIAKDGFEFIAKIKAEGKAKNVGFSFHDSAELLDTILTEHPEVDFVQLQINYVDWEDDNVQSRLCYEVATKHNIPVIVMEPVKGGDLANVTAEADKLFKEYHPDMSTASWAVRYAASFENVFMVLSGMSNLEQLLDNTSYMEEFAPLNDTERGIISKVEDIVRNSIAIPCTACKYCVEGCPQNIPIPDYFALYNKQSQFGLTQAYRDRYAELISSAGKASDCISCGQCEQHCPQHLSVAELLRDVAEKFE
ncbi:MAG: aldo/keto reductase [Oscillospiraceae bacterium]|jgi:predicted aldo/keto reductase-like oxidoreductase|nr:aldo/keto reductase [Oscillospiraceae bacterium]